MDMSAAHLPEPITQNMIQPAHLFISYAREDQTFALRLAGALKKRGYRIWIDQNSIRGGLPWQQSIADGIDNSKIVLWIVSPRSITSEWVEAEIKMALERQKIVIPIQPVALGERYVHFPTLRWVLNKLQILDFSQDYTKAFRELVSQLLVLSIDSHRKQMVEHLEKRISWGIAWEYLDEKSALVPIRDSYIEEHARTIPISATPFESTVSHQRTGNLLDFMMIHDRVIVLGEPGMGKSVALERLAWQLARDPRSKTIPVSIKLLDYDGNPLLDWIAYSLNAMGEIRLKNAEAVEQFLNESEVDCYFLLDGINEVPVKYQDVLVNEVRRFISKFPQHRIAITSRVHDENWQMLPHGNKPWQVFQIERIQPEQATDYLKLHLGEQQGKLLWHKLDPKMQGLATNPLLLWMVLEVWLKLSKGKQRLSRLALPENRAELYEEFIDKMLHLDEVKRLISVPIRRQTAALRRLARRMHQHKVFTISRDEALEVIGGDDEEMTLKALLYSGLLTGDKHISFGPHPTMQEFFAALSLRGEATEEIEKRRSNGLFGSLLPRRPDGIFRNAVDNWWDETFVHLAGLVKNPDDFTSTVAEVNPWLAWWCVQEGKKVDPAISLKIEKRSIELVKSSNPVDRRNAAQSLGQLRTPRVIEILARLSDDSHPTVSSIADQALLQYGEVGADILKRKLTDKPPAERAEWGRRISTYDLRPGVNLRPDGLPDIAWSKEILPDVWTDTLSEHNQVIEFDYVYKVARYPVTYKQFQAFYESEEYRKKSYWTKAGWQWLSTQTGMPYWNDPEWHIDNHPVVGVSWYAAFAYCRWLSEQYRSRGIRPVYTSKWEIRLPTEMEWLVAAVYDDGRQYPWGGYDYLRGYANVVEPPPSHSLGRTSAVGIYHQGTSELRIDDLTGNVWEWCASHFDGKHTYPENNHPEGNGHRAVRGAAWNVPAQEAHVSNRDACRPESTSNTIGFRVICGLPLKDLVNRWAARDQR